MFKILSLLSVLLVLLSNPAMACMGYDMEHSILFHEVPEQAAEADIIAKVVFADDIDWDNAREQDWPGVTAEVIEAVKGPIKAGDKVLLKLKPSSCGPWHKKGEEGLVAAKSLETKDGIAVLQPYMHNRSGDSDGVVPAPIQE